MEPSHPPELLKVQACIRMWLGIKRAEKRVRKEAFRQRVAREMLDTEMSYLRDILIIRDEFKAKMELDAKKSALLFGNIDELIPTHMALMRDLKKRIDTWKHAQTLGDVFITHADSMTAYTEYINNYTEAAEFLDRERKSASSLAKMVEAREKSTLCRGMRLESFLVMPIQRLPRYSLLLKELSKYTSCQHPDRAFLEQAIAQFALITAGLNESRRAKDSAQRTLAISHSVIGFKQASVAESIFLLEGPLSYNIRLQPQGPDLYKTLLKSGPAVGLPSPILTPKKDKPKKEESTTKKDGWKHAYVFMFSDYLLLAKKIKSQSVMNIKGLLSGKGFHKFSAMKTISLNPDTKLELGDNDTFKLVSPMGMHEFKAPSAAARTEWVTNLHKSFIRA